MARALHRRLPEPHVKADALDGNVVSYAEALVGDQGRVKDCSYEKLVAAERKGKREKNRSTRKTCSAMQLA